MSDVKLKSLNLAKKLDRISENFGDLVSMADEIIDEVDTELHDLEENTNLLETNQVLVMMCDDIIYSRNMIKDTIRKANSVLNNVSQSINDGEDFDADMISSFSQLTGVVNTSLKLLSDIYKTMSETRIKIEKSDKEKEKEEDPLIGGAAPKSLTQNNVYITASLNDVIANLKGIQGGTNATDTVVE